MQDKVKIRKEFLARRMKLTPEVVSARSRGMCDFLETWLKSRNFPEIFLFNPFRNEPDLTPLISRTAAAVHMPVVISQSQMHFFHVSVRTVYQAGKWGLLEPVPEPSAQPVQPGRNSLIVMPALAADRNGCRLGYGGGFYDRFLQLHESTLMVALFDEFIVPKVPAEAHDIQVNFILTESGVSAVHPA